MSTRCFRYNTQLLLEYGAPVLTTVLYLFPPPPKQEPVFRVLLGGVELNRWSFEAICLWELDARMSCWLSRAGIYTDTDLARMVGRDRMIQSSLYVAGKAEGLAEGEAKGEAKGRLQSERELCAALAFKHHPGVFDRARPLIEACPDPARLKEWALAASDLDDSAFLRLIGA